MRDDRQDDRSYEFGNADRAAQYYGELYWSSVAAFLEATLES